MQLVNHKYHEPFSIIWYQFLHPTKPQHQKRLRCLLLHKSSGTSPREICIEKGLKREEWDLRQARPKQKNDYLIKLTLQLDSVRVKLYEIYLDIKRNSGELTAENIKNISLGKGTVEITILQLIDRAINKYKIELTWGALKNYGTTRAYVASFCKTKSKIGDVPLKLLTYAFVDELKDYILSNPMMPNNPCSNNGCMRHIDRLKKIVTWAYEMRLIDRDVFASFKVKKTPYESRRLCWEQLKDLEQRLFQRPMLNLVKDLFVFSCYTGMAPVDLQGLQPCQIGSEADGLVWLSYIRSKSKVPANVPLLKKALELIEKYALKKGDPPRPTVFPLVTNKDLNTNLKIISEVCGFGFLLNFYVARYMFATTVTLLHGVPITSIKEMLGHRKIESTGHYAKADKSVVARDMMSLQGKIDSDTIMY